MIGDYRVVVPNWDTLISCNGWIIDDGNCMGVGVVINAISDTHFYAIFPRELAPSQSI